MLEHAGLISRSREAQWRPCRIAPIAFRQVDGWLGNFRRFWDENFDRLDDYLQEMKAQGGGRRCGDEGQRRRQTQVRATEGEAAWTQKQIRP